MRTQLALLGLLLIPSFAWSATTYIDPTCTFDGDGTVTSPCASSGGAVGPKNVWPTVSGAGNSFLQKAGTTYLFQVSVNSGSAGNPVTLGSYGSGAKPIIRSEENAATGTIKINTDAHDIVIDGLEVHGQLNVTPGTQINAVRNNVTGGNRNIVVNITVQNSKIANVVDQGAGTGNDGLDLNGRGLTILNNEFIDIFDDAVGISSDGAVGDVLVRGNTCSRVSIGSTNGDCYSMFGTSSRSLWEDNYCDKTTADAKYCFAVNSPSPIIRYNTIEAYANASVNSGVYCDGDDCEVYGNRVNGGYSGIRMQGVNGKAYGNVVTGYGNSGIVAGGTGVRICNNTLTSSLSPLSAVLLEAGSTNAVACNNAISNANQGVRLYSGSGHTETNNGFIGTITTPVYNVTTTSALAATNGITASNQLTSEYKSVGDSSLRQTGDAWAGCLDFRGRACNNPPDIGAYQASSGDQATTRTAASARSAATTRTAASARTARD